ncbi:MAG TPA: hypothetical protein VMH86_00325 [Rhizomicrobium sp.]|nr:hypothetical protein [Rhizomicrobium sp.]
MSALTDIWNTIHGILTSNDWMLLGTILIACIVIAWFTEGLSALLNSTVMALILIAVATFAEAAIKAGGKDIGTLAQTDWGVLMKMTVGTLIAYAIICAVIVAVVSAIKSAIGR